MTETSSEPLLLLGDCLDRLREMDDNSVDSVVTDPPYGLSFMGKKWDYDVPSEEIWRECLRVLKPGGHLLAFAGTRTQHRMAVRIEDAGFEIRDMIAWVYGSGFPKSHDVSKAIDRAAGALKPEGKGFTVAGYSHAPEKLLHTAPSKGYTPPPPATEAARQWQGWGTALKPALEPITVARKPLIGTVAENVLAHGTGGLNIDGCRVGTETITQRLATVEGGKAIGGKGVGVKQKATGETTTTIGRWPANLIHDGSDEVVGLFPVTGAAKTGVRDPNGTMGYHGGASGLPGVVSGHDDNGGSAARFFYCAKASKKDRDEGCDGLAEVPRFNGGLAGASIPLKGSPMPVGRNNHPTVKPTALMRYLCRLVTPPEGIVLDPFMGSGSTGKAAMLEGFQFIGIERDEEYMRIAKNRISAAIQSKLPITECS